MTIELPASVRRSMFDHAGDGDPREVVGVLAGTHGDTSAIERGYRATNAADDPRVRYEIAPGEELELLERIDDDGHDVVGFYHSHPRGPLEPSATDARLAAWPDYSYLIVSLAADPPAVGSWRWRGDGFEREPVRSV